MTVTKSPPESMSDTMSPGYDEEDMAHFLGVRTDVSDYDVWKFIRSKDRYELGLGIASPGEPSDARLRNSLRSLFPDLFPPRCLELRCLCLPLRTEFIELDSGIEEGVIARLSEAEEEFLRKRGIIIDCE